MARKLRECRHGLKRVICYEGTIDEGFRYWAAVNDGKGGWVEDNDR
jgi:hypothetical protein